MPTTAIPPHRLASRVSNITLAASQVAFTLSFLLAMLTPTWRDGAFARMTVLAFRVSGLSFQIGAFTLLPLIAGITWIASCLLRKSGGKPRPWQTHSDGWGPAYLALPILGLGTLVLVRVWPMHIQHTAAVTVVAIAVFWYAYVYALSEWSVRWAVASMAVLLAVQGTIGTLQFVKQSSVGLSWMGERWLDPQVGEGMSVIAVAGRRWLRAYGLTPHPNALGGYLSMSLLICLGAMASRDTRSRRWLGLAITLGSAGLLFTFSRSAWLGTLAGLTYMAGVIRPWRRINWRSTRTRRTAAAVGALLLVVAIAIPLAFGDLLAARFFRLGDPLERRSLDDRIHDIREAWSLIRTVPLKGTGSGYYLGALWAGVGEDRPPGFRKVHNVPLLAAAELGIAGAILWLLMLLGPPIAFARQHRHRRRDAAEGAACAAPCAAPCAGWASAFVSALILSMLDNYLYITTVWWAALYLGVLNGQWARSQWAQRPTSTRTRGEQQ